MIALNLPAETRKTFTLVRTGQRLAFVLHRVIKSDEVDEHRSLSQCQRHIEMAAVPPEAAMAMTVDMCQWRPLVDELFQRPTADLVGT